MINEPHTTEAATVPLAGPESPQVEALASEPTQMPELFPRLGRRPEKRKRELMALLRKATKLKGRKQKQQDAAAKTKRKRAVIALKREVGRRLMPHELPFG